MSLTIDLNADMGESFGPWPMGDDAALLEAVSSANIACGFHGGDADVMARTMALALEHGVALGAHPGFPDLQGFGRRRMELPHATLANMTRYQLGAAQGMARAAGGRIAHLKLHGALSNMAAEEEALATACYAAALDLDPEIILVVMPGTAMERAARGLGARLALEVFADRAYEDDGTLTPRSQPGAVLHEAEAIAARVVAMVRDGAVTARSGRRVALEADTVCLHGDTPQAAAIARRVRAALEAAGIEVRPCGPPARAG